MLDEVDYASDTSDEDFVPQGVEINSEDDDEIDDEPISGENDNEIGGKKSKKKRKKKSDEISEKFVEENKETDDKIDKQKEENLWADFLADVGDEEPAKDTSTKPKSSNSWSAILGIKKNKKDSENTEDAKISASSKDTSKPAKIPEVKQPETVKLTKIYEFAGEEVKVEEEVAADSAEAKKVATETKLNSGTKRPIGLSGVMNFIDNKKKKLTTLEKTKIDWNRFKTKEGIEEELETHKKSKMGYLEKQAFLERADLREFEIEKSIRVKNRTNR